MIFPGKRTIFSRWGAAFRRQGVVGGGIALFFVSIWAVFTAAVLAEVQTDYPAIGKIVVHGEKVATDEGESQAIYYGSGVYVAEAGELGIVLTNWHVVSGGSGLMEVRFPTFQSTGMVILADEVWDLAAIVVRKPPFLPVPISLEVPQIGDELWVAGYGHNSGLDEFQLSSGPVLNYSSLDYHWYPTVKEPLPGETLMVGTAVRFGDSGGPILNRSGEVAGILSGSDGNLTIGTFCLRVQAFLTQAQFQLANVAEPAEPFFAKANEGKIPTKKISVASVPAQQALAASGVFPISSVPIYVRPRPVRYLRRLPSYYKPATRTDIADEADSKANSEPSADFLAKQNAYKSAHRNGFSMPPYPPMESPTLLAQRKTIGSAHPEVYPNGAKEPRLAGVTANNTGQNAANAAASAAESSVSMAMTGADQLAPVANPGAKPGANDKADSDDFQPVSLSADAETATDTAVTPESAAESAAESSSAAPESGTTSKKTLKQILPFLPDVELFNVQTIIVIVVILFLFINSLRLLSIAAERPKKEK